MQSDPTIPLQRPMLHALAKTWWLLLLRGLIAIGFGLLAFLWPGVTLVTLVFLYGAFALADGVLELAAAFGGRGGAVPVWWLVIGGIAGIAAGLLAFFWPGITALVLVMFIGAWALVRGVFEIVGAIHLRKQIDNEWLLIGAGVLSVIFGLFVLVAPGAGALALIWVMGAYAIVFGIAMVGLALRLRKHLAAGAT